MKPQYILATLDESVKTVQVMFQQHMEAYDNRGNPRPSVSVKNLGFVGKSYTYLTKNECKVNDLAVVDSPCSGIAVVKIVEIDEVPDMTPDSAELKWLITTFQMEEYLADMQIYDEQVKEMRKRMAAHTRKKLQAAVLEDFGDLKSLTS